MINYLEGKPVISSNQLTVLINGVGYAVLVGGRTLASLGSDQVALHIYTHVRGDKLELLSLIHISEPTRPY